MIIQQISADYTANTTGSVYRTRTASAYQAARPVKVASSKAYTVELSDSAKARSLKLQGYSIAMIANKLRLDQKMVLLFLGVTEKATPAIAKSTYSAPKTVSTEPSSVSRSRSQLTQDLNMMSIIPFTWNNLIHTQLMQHYGSA